MAAASDASVTATALDASSEAAAAPPAPHSDASGGTETPPDAFERRYARSRAKDDAVRAKLKPLTPGERPTAVTVGAIVSGVLALANAVALALGYNSGEGNLLGQSIVATLLMALVAYGMWNAKYWAVLGMEALLAITIIFAAMALMTAVNAWAAILMVLIIAGAGTLFWFLIKAMARIQMPTPPSQRPR